MAKKKISALDQFAKAARDAGMTYGQYQALETVKALKGHKTKDKKKKVKQDGRCEMDQDYN